MGNASMSDLQELRFLEIDECIRNPVYFCEHYGHIEDRTKDEIVQPFRLWPAQRQALKELKENKQNIILKARQLGFSWLVVHYAITVMLRPGRVVVGLSRSENEAMELIRRAVFICDNCLGLIYDKKKAPLGWTGSTFEWTALKLVIHHPDGPDSTFQGFASNENAARSFTADLLIFDEWAFQQFDRQIWASAFPIINRPGSGQFIGLSTIKRGSLFEEIYITENNGFHKMFLPWTADPSRTQEWYDKTKASIGDEIYAEYPATVDEALTVPGGAFFAEVTRESFISHEELKGKVNTYFVMDYGLDMFAGYWINRDAYGNAQIIKEHCEPNLTIGACAQTIIDLSRDYNVVQYLAPSDIWNRSQETGRSRADLFAENGVNLTKVNRDLVAGCAAMKEYLYHKPGEKSKLTAYRDCAPEAYKCITKIQKDEKRPNVYANDPHSLTHSNDALRYFCIYWTVGADNGESQKRVHWRPDQWEDYENANEREKQMLIERWGNPE